MNSENRFTVSGRSLGKNAKAKAPERRQEHDQTQVARRRDCHHIVANVAAIRLVMNDPTPSVPRTIRRSVRIDFPSSHVPEKARQHKQADRADDDQHHILPQPARLHAAQRNARAE